jgi:hypothetical protein
MFASIFTIIQERDQLRFENSHLKAENQKLSAANANLIEDFNSVRLDYRSAQNKYNELYGIQSAKQVMLWRLIERLQYGYGGMVDSNQAKVTGFEVYGDRGETLYSPTLTSMSAVSELSEPSSDSTRESTPPPPWNSSSASPRKKRNKKGKGYHAMPGPSSPLKEYARPVMGHESPVKWVGSLVKVVKMDPNAVSA